MLQGQPSVLFAGARWLAAGADALEMQASAMERPVRAVLAGPGGWSGRGATAYRIALERDLAHLRAAAGTLRSMATIWHALGIRLETIDGLRQEADRLRAEATALTGGLPTPAALAEAGLLLTRAATLTAEADAEATLADRQGAAAFAALAMPWARPHGRRSPAGAIGRVLNHPGALWQGIVAGADQALSLGLLRLPPPRHLSLAYQAGRVLGDGGAVLGGTLATLRGLTTIAGGGITAMAGVGLAVGGSETMVLSPVGAAVAAAGAAEIGAGAALTAQGLVTTGRAVAQGIQDGRILMAQADPGSGTGSSVSEGTGDVIKVGNTILKDGMKVPTNDALDYAEKFLGNGYKEVGNGRYVSTDGTRVVRMGNNDILGKHGGGPHMNFEVLEPNLAKPGKMIVVQNYHIYLEGK